jgi:hypothetical protein
LDAFGVTRVESAGKFLADSVHPLLGGVNFRPELVEFVLLHQVIGSEVDDRQSADDTYESVYTRLQGGFEYLMLVGRRSMFFRGDRGWFSLTARLLAGSWGSLGFSVHERIVPAGGGKTQKAAKSLAGGKKRSYRP